jgi:hypothetical protein
VRRDWDRKIGPVCLPWDFFTVNAPAELTGNVDFLPQGSYFMSDISAEVAKLADAPS